MHTHTKTDVGRQTDRQAGRQAQTNKHKSNVSHQHAPSHELPLPPPFPLLPPPPLSGLSLDQVRVKGFGDECEPVWKYLKENSPVLLSKEIWWCVREKPKHEANLIPQMHQHPSLLLFIMIGSRDHLILQTYSHVELLELGPRSPNLVLTCCSSSSLARSGTLKRFSWTGKAR